ncbi:hypothetical protein U9M48_044811 [Paspalum notatum var. saurae]|uniref:F-box protein n=1 Tax=Paspalum notatum var. saurae TaxID=547442 RepID=A0AAQ3V0I8_PASNO
MSDFVGSRYDKQEDFQVLLSKKSPGESPQQKHYLWMAHWTKASSSAEPQTGRSSSPLEDINKGTATKDSEALPYEFMKSAVTERLMVGVRRGSASMQHDRRFSSSMWGVAPDVCNGLEQNNTEQGDDPFERSMKKNAANLHASALVSETYSVHKLSELPPNFQKLGSSENPSLDWSHFPMFEINRKIDNILNRKRRSALGPASLNLNMSTSHVMEISSQEYRLHSQQIADENMDTCKLARGFTSRLEDPAGLNSDPSRKKLKGQILDTLSCSCSKDDNNSSGCPIDEQHTSHYCANSVHELPCASNEKELKFAGNSNNRISLSAFHNIKTRRLGDHKQHDAAGAMHCAPVLGRECQNEPVDLFNNSSKDCDNFQETYKSHGNAVPSFLLPYEQQYLKAQRTESAANFQVCMLPDQIANKSTEKSIREPVTHGPKSKEMYTGSCNQRGPFLFEKLTLPSKSQSAYTKNSASSGKSSGFGVCMYGTNIGSHLFGVQNQASAKTETLYSDTPFGSKSSAGIATLSAQKGHGSPNESKHEQLATPSKTGYSEENGFHNMNESRDVLSKATVASKHSCMPAAKITNLDLILSQMTRMRNQISSGIVQAPISAKPTDRWLKRLQHDVSDPDIPGSKRPNNGGSPPLRQTDCLFDMALPCGYDIETTNSVKEDQALDEANKLQDKQQRSPVAAKSMNSWIGRWCQGGVPVFHEGSGQVRQTTRHGQLSEELEGQFPSIAAMAMMGRVMNKLRPCEHQKKGPFVVWKTD